MKVLNLSLHIMITKKRQTHCSTPSKDKSSKPVKPLRICMHNYHHWISQLQFTQLYVHVQHVSLLLLLNWNNQSVVQTPKWLLPQCQKMKSCNKNKKGKRNQTIQKEKKNSIFQNNLNEERKVSASNNGFFFLKMKNARNNSLNKFICKVYRQRHSAVWQNQWQAVNQWTHRTLVRHSFWMTNDSDNKERQKSSVISGHAFCYLIIILRKNDKVERLQSEKKVHVRKPFISWTDLKYNVNNDQNAIYFVVYFFSLTLF